MKARCGPTTALSNILAERAPCQISFTVSPTDRARLASLIKDRNTPQKHVWRAEILLLSADGVGTVAIMRQTGKSKTCVWRWQERFAAEGFDGLLRDKTRPSRIPPLGPEVAERVVGSDRNRFQFAAYIG